MPFRLRFHPAAELDVLAATLWYDEQRAGLGSEFLEHLTSLLERIAEAPLQFPVIEGLIRRALLRRFPFGVYFVTIDEAVTVLAVLHLHRHPDTWKPRRL